MKFLFRSYTSHLGANRLRARPFSDEKASVQSLLKDKPPDILDGRRQSRRRHDDLDAVHPLRAKDELVPGVRGLTICTSIAQ